MVFSKKKNTKKTNKAKTQNKTGEIILKKLNQDRVV